MMFLVVSSGFGGNGGSGYSIYGLGDVQYYSSSYAMSLGGAAIAVTSPFSIDRPNPAQWTGINRVQVALSTLYEGYATSDYQTSGYFASVQFGGGMIAIPIIAQRGITFSAGAVPYTRINYDILLPGSQNGYDFNVHYIGSGGLSQAYLGLSWSPWTDLDVGIKLDYYFGTLSHIIRQEFPGSGLTTAEVEHFTRMNGVGFSFGAIYTGLDRFFELPEDHTFNIGGLISTSPYLTTGDEQHYTYTTTQVTYDTVLSPTGKFHLPLRLEGGIAYQTTRWTVTTNLISQLWEKATQDGSPIPDLRTSYRWNLGGELISGSTSLRSGSQRVTVRAGIYYDATYYQVKGTAINERGISFGYGFPIFNQSRLDLAALVGMRGTTDERLQKDWIIRIGGTLNVGEIWFVKPPEE